MHIKTEDFYKDISGDVDNGLILLILIKMIIDIQKLVKTKRCLVNLRMRLMVK